MFKHIRNMHPIAGVAVGVVATLVLSGTAIAVTDTTFTYSTVKTGYYTIHPMDMSAGNGASDYSVDVVAGTLFTSSGGCFNTGVNLPQLAKVTTVEASYIGLTTIGTGVYLSRKNQAAGTGELLASRSITDTDGVRRSLTLTVPNDKRTVWSNVYSYGFGICLDAGETFHGARITYTYTSAGD